MENNNLPPFYPGQKVVYITGHNMPKGSIHAVESCFKQECGCWALYIACDKSTKRLDADFWSCPECGKKVNYRPVIRQSWCASSFRPIQQQRFPLIKLSQIKEQELCAN